MATSILLLLALQFFWLTSSYEKAYMDLRKDTNNLFESTIGALRDSLFIKNFERIPSDTASRATGLIFKAEKDTSFVWKGSSKEIGRAHV